MSDVYEMIAEQFDKLCDDIIADATDYVRRSECVEMDDVYVAVDECGGDHLAAKWRNDCVDAVCCAIITASHCIHINDDTLERHFVIALAEAMRDDKYDTVCAMLRTLR